MDQRAGPPSYVGAASAWLAAFEGRPELWPRAEAAAARLAGRASRLAGGLGVAERPRRRHRRLLAVTVYSPKSLEIDAHGVVETRLGTSESAYRYRYDGLRLVQRSGDRYLLMSERWDDRTSRIIVLRDTDAIRMEFAR